MANMTSHDDDEIILELVRAEKGKGDTLLAQQLFEGVLGRLDADGADTRYLSRIASMDMRLSDPRAPEALRTLWIRDRIVDQADAGLFDVTRARFELRGGRYTSSRHEAEKVYRDYLCLSRHRLRACSILGVSEVSMGRIEVGLQYVDQAEMMFAILGITSYEREDAASQFFSARYITGDWDRARSAMRWAESDDRMTNFAGALVDVRTGHLARAQATLADVLSQSHETDFVDLTRIGRAAKRYADGLLGTRSTSEGLPDESLIEDRVDRYSWWAEFEANLFDLQTLALAQPDRAAAKLYLLGESAWDRDAATMATSAWVEAARLGHRSGIERLGTAADSIDGALGRLAAVMASSLSTGDPKSLLNAAREALAYGAVVTCSGLARRAQQRAIQVEDRHVVKEARILIGNTTRSIRFSSGGSRLQAVLSDFERRIVSGVMHGESSRELGAALHLSARTVEWHLTRIYRRLHVSNRRELRDVVSTWKEQG